MHPGWAGVAGLTAAHLARAGYKGPSKVYEGRFGLYRIYLGEHAASVRYDSIAETLGKVWEVHGIAIKPYPICHLIHACADAALLLREQHALASDDIERVVALVPKQSMHLISEPHDIKVRPANDYDAKFSTQYVVATCLVKGRFGLEELQESALKDAQVLALAAKVECIADPDSKYPEFFSGGVEIHMRDGRVLRHHEPVNRGAGERALSGEEIERKYFDNAVLAVNRSKAEAIRDAILEIEKYPATEFARLLSAAGAA
jgi:2-methylcitrate dehydratase PrpD